MRHGRRTYLTLFDLLLEILHRDVLPEVPVEVDDDCIDAAQRVEQRGQVVVVGDLGRPRLPLDTESLFQETVPEGGPVDVRIGKVMGIEVTRGTTEFTAHRHGLEQFDLFFETIAEYPYLFSQAGGRCRLAVRLGQHGNIFPLLGIMVNQRQHLVEHRHVAVVQRLFDQQGHRGVVDILRREPEVNKLLVGFEVQRVEFLLDEILDSLHVVVGNRLNRLHPSGIGLGKVLIDSPQLGEEVVVYPRKLRQG